MNTRYGVWLKRARKRREGRDTIRYGWAWENHEYGGETKTCFQRGEIPKAAFVFLHQENAEAYALKVAMNNPETMGHLEIRLFAVPEYLKATFDRESPDAATPVPDHH